MGLLQFILNVPQDVYVVGSRANPLSPKIHGILNTYKDVFQELGHLGDSTFVTDETVCETSPTHTRGDVFLSPYAERLKTNCWILRERQRQEGHGPY